MVQEVTCMKKLINQIAKFGVVGIIATLIDYILLFILTDVFKIYYMTSSIISFSVSLIFNYIASIKWVFNVEHKQTYKDGLLFLIFSLIGLWINQEVMYLTVEKLGIYYMISKIFATGIVMVWNFITRKIFIENYEKVVVFLKKHSITIIFVTFFLLVLLQHQFLWIYFDDYGYGSLSYAYQVDGVVGHNYSIIDILRFCIGHYQYWGGRVLYFFFECFLLKLGLPVFRLVQSLVITFIAYYIYKIVCKYIQKNKEIIALLSCFVYFTIEILVFRSGIFWVTASILYLFPILPFVMFIYYHDENSKKNTILCMFLIFLASFSQEQIGCAMLGYIILKSVWDFIQNKKWNKKNIIMIITSMIGFGILMASPGTKIRMQHPQNIDFYQLGMVEKLKITIPDILSNIFNQYNKIFIILLLISILYMTYKTIEKKKIISCISFISTAVLLILTILKGGYYEFLSNVSNKPIWEVITNGIIIIQLMFMVYSVSIYFYKKKQMELLFLFYSSCISQGVMLVSSYYPARSIIMFEYFNYVIIIYCAMNYLKNIKNFQLFLIPIFIVLFYNYSYITYGYYKNNQINKYNDTVLSHSSNEETIYLKKQADDLFSLEQPYMENCEYIADWIKKYYNIDKDSKLIYE